MRCHSALNWPRSCVSHRARLQKKSLLRWARFPDSQNLNSLAPDTLTPAWTANLRQGGYSKRAQDGHPYTTTRQEFWSNTPASTPTRLLTSVTFATPFWATPLFNF